MTSSSDPRDSFLSSIKLPAVRVEPANAPIVLLCGGPNPPTTQESGEVINAASLRQAITQAQTPFELFLPEEITRWQEDGIYPNLMEYEKDLAGICSLVVVVIESAGSIAELGAFSQLEEMSDRLYVIRRIIDGEDTSLSIWGYLGI